MLWRIEAGPPFSSIFSWHFERGRVYLSGRFEKGFTMYDDTAFFDTTAQRFLIESPNRFEIFCPWTPKPKAKDRLPAKAARPSAHKRQDVAKLASAAERRIAAAKDPAEALAVERDLDTFETHMKNAGLYTPDELREINEIRMRARYRLGGLLAKIERGAGPGRGKKKSAGRRT